MSTTKTQAELQSKAGPTPNMEKQPEPPEQQAGPSPTAQTTTSMPPPLNGNPSAMRTADVMMAPGQGVGHIGRARMMSSMQRTMGNARLSRLWGTTVQAKLTVGAPNDPYEQEADRVARQVVSQKASSTQRGGQRPGEAAEPWQAKMQATSGPQHCPECNKKLQRDPSATLCPSCAATLQRQATSAATPEVTPEIENQINTNRGNSQTLTDSVRAPMEQGMGADFSGVRVHTDSTADHLTRSLNARAFTTGQDIFFQQGEFNPGTSSGRELLAHELTHVVQQDGEQLQRARTQAKEGAATGGAPSEREKRPVNFLSTQGHGVSRTNTIRSKEFGPTDDPKTMQDGDRTYMDRLTQAEPWDKANSYNLENGRSRQYTQIDQRRNFYLWFYEKMRSRGHEIKWPLAAYVVAGGANEVARKVSCRMECNAWQYTRTTDEKR